MEFLRYVAQYTSGNVIFFGPAGLSQCRINLSITLRLKFQLQTRTGKVCKVIAPLDESILATHEVKHYSAQTSATNYLYTAYKQLAGQPVQETDQPQQHKLRNTTYSFMQAVGFEPTFQALEC